jgi:hypothetical protein
MLSRPVNNIMIYLIEKQKLMSQLFFIRDHICIHRWTKIMSRINYKSLIGYNFITHHRNPYRLQHL